MYETNSTTLSTQLSQSSTQVFTDDTIARILALSPTGSDTVIAVDTVAAANNSAVTVAAGTEVAFVRTSDTAATTLLVSDYIPVTIFQGRGVNVTYRNLPPTAADELPAGASAAAPQGAAAAGTVERVVVGTAFADSFTVNDGRNSQVTAGDGDTITGGTGHDTVIAAQGSSTIVGGTHTIVQAAGLESDYTVTVAGSHALISNSKTGVKADITKVQYVDLNGNDALVFAKDSNQAAVAMLYETLFGRNADEGGLQFWLDKVAAGFSLNEIARGFLMSAEYQPQASLSDTDFLQGLYQHSFRRAADAGGLDFWLNALNQGVSRADVAAGFSLAAALNMDGTLHTEATIVGTVTIVPGVV